MTKHRRQTLIAALTVLSLSITSPALIAGTAWAQTQQEKEAATLINQLKTADEFTRDDTVQALAEIGEPAIPTLIKALESDSFVVRQGAVEALQKIGDPAIPALNKALDSTNPRVALLAIEALSKNPDDPVISALIFPQEAPVISALIKQLKDTNANTNAKVRSSAAKTLARIGPEAKEAVPELINALRDSDPEVRRYAAEALGSICSGSGSLDWDASTEAKAAVPELINALRDPDVGVRGSAAYALGNIGPKAKEAVPELIKVLGDPDAGVRRGAAFGLGWMRSEAKVVVPELIKALRDPDAGVRGWAAFALGRIGSEAKAAVPELIKALRDPDAGIRNNAAVALNWIGPEAKAAVPELIKALDDSDADVRPRAAWTLGDIGSEAKEAIPELLVHALNSTDNSHNAASAITSIVLDLQENANTLSPKELDQVIKDLEIALKKLEENKNKTDFSTEDIATIRLSLNALKAKRNANLTYLIHQYPWATGILFYLLFFPSLWFLIFWLRPRWLLHISNALKPYEFKLPETWGGAPVRIRDLTFLSFFVYQPRVLDAWVAKQIVTVREEFPKLETVKRRTTYVPVAVELDDQKIPQLTPTNLQEIFQKKRICLLIWGEGGIGKTSIACQMAQWAMEADTTKSLCKHPMIPILIEEELDNQIISSKDAFLEAIRGQLKTLTHHPTPIDETLLKHLLQQRRLLVMVDHFSELSEATQKQIDPDAAEFPVNALVVTSRLENSLGKINKTNLHPLRIEGAELSDFMQKYLDKLDKLDLLTAPQFHYICGDLAKLLEEIKAQGRSTTVLFAKLYADVLIAKLEGNQDGMLPETIPDLMLSYLNELNRDVTGNKLTDRTIHQDAQIIAWECLKATYRPTPAKITEIMATLAALNSQDIDLRLNYLEEKLRLIQTVGSAKDKIKFSLDPVAEYLAGLYLVEQYGKDNQKWQTFLQNADMQAGSPDAIKGFLLAVRDCYLAKLESAKSTDFLPEEIAKRCIPATTTPPQKVPVGSP